MLVLLTKTQHYPSLLSSARWGDVTVLEKFTELGPGRTVEAPHTVQHCNTDGDLDHNTIINHFNPTHWSHTPHYLLRPF